MTGAREASDRVQWRNALFLAVVVILIGVLAVAGWEFGEWVYFSVWSRLRESSIR